ncbi:MAG TPA: type II toxin-antitoxin system CcdA family antitoxin [Pyrinomonadaceae bacterium]|nr:type II toxin-antitoxin system CcdA family antitoxin [Pyrinomonadaceae bacterium]
MQTVERIETTVSLPRDLLEKANRMNKDIEISDVIETALRDYLAKENRKELNKRDIEIINENADLINRQVKETLEFQAEW